MNKNYSKQLNSGSSFIKTLTKLYEKQWEPWGHNGIITRGRRRSLSGTSEEVFAEFLARNDNTIDHIYVDQAITPSAQKDGKSTNQGGQVYPDLTIVKNGKVVGFIDVKTDMGYKRTGIAQMCSNHDRDLLRLKSGQVKLKSKGSEIFLNVSRSAKYHTIIISSENSGKKGRLSEQIDAVSKNNHKGAVIVVCRGAHPGDAKKGREALYEKIDWDDVEENWEQVLSLLKAMA